MAKEFLIQFAPDARDALHQAYKLAQGDPCVSTGRLLRAILEQDTRVSETLQDLGVTPALVEQQMQVLRDQGISEVHAPGASGRRFLGRSRPFLTVIDKVASLLPGSFGLSPKAKELLESAAQYAYLHGAATMDSVHLVLQLFDCIDSDAYRILREAGVSRDDFQRRLS